MFRFGGFKASLNFSGRSTSNYAENIPTISTTTGAYRVKKDEFYGNGTLKNPTPRVILPSMVKLPPSSQNDAIRTSKSVGDVRQPHIPSPPPFPSSEVIRPTKSTGDLTQTVEVTAPTKVISTSKLANTKVDATESNTQAIVKTAASNNDLDQTANVKPKLRTDADVSSNPKGGPSNYRDSVNLRKVNNKDAKKQEKEQKMIEKKRLAEQKKNEKKRLAEQNKNEKKRLAEQKKNEKLAAQERAKQEKLRKEQEKREAKLAKQKAKNEKKNKGKNAPVPMPRVNPLAQGAGVHPSPAPGPVPTQAPPQYATNTLQSSISRTSGPPAYADIPTPKEQTPQRVQNENDASGNTSSTKRVDSVNSWDLIAEHRQQITRPGVAGASKPRQKVTDLQYHTGRPADDRDRQTEA